MSRGSDTARPYPGSPGQGFRHLGLGLAAAGMLIIGGCASTEEGTEKEEESVPVLEAPAPVSFEMSTDTVEVLRRGERGSGVLETQSGDTLYSVQIGAFKEPANAASAEERARERFPHPILRYQDLTAGLYHVRVGRFATRGAAEELKAEMQSAYPRDYGDCWIVLLTVTQ